MTAATGNAVEEAQIRALIDDRARAVRAKDVNGAVSSSAPDILSFDVVNPLQHIGSDASRKRTEDWFSSFQGPIGYEIRNLSISAGDDVAFSHGLSAQPVKTEDNSISGGARPFASARLTASGWSRTSITRCLSMWRAAKRHWI